MYTVLENKMTEAGKQPKKARGRGGALDYAFVLGALPANVLLVLCLQYLKAPLLGPSS